LLISIKTAPEDPVFNGVGEWRPGFYGGAGGLPPRFIEREMGMADFAPEPPLVAFKFEFPAACSVG